MSKTSDFLHWVLTESLFGFALLLLIGLPIIGILYIPLHIYSFYMRRRFIRFKDGLYALTLENYRKKKIEVIAKLTKVESKFRYISGEGKFSVFSTVHLLKVELIASSSNSELSLDADYKAQIVIVSDSYGNLEKRTKHDTYAGEFSIKYLKKIESLDP